MWRVVEGLRQKSELLSLTSGLSSFIFASLVQADVRKLISGIVLSNQQDILSN